MYDTSESIGLRLNVATTEPITIANIFAKQNMQKSFTLAFIKNNIISGKLFSPPLQHKAAIPSTS